MFILLWNISILIVPLSSRRTLELNPLLQWLSSDSSHNYCNSDVNVQKSKPKRCFKQNPKVKVKATKRVFFCSKRNPNSSKRLEKHYMMNVLQLEADFMGVRNIAVWCVCVWVCVIIYHKYASPIYKPDSWNAVVFPRSCPYIAAQTPHT